MKLRASFGLFAIFLVCATFGYAADPANPNVVVQWNEKVLQGVRDSTLGPPMVARALAIVHTCAYDAWAAYDRHAVGTQFGGALRRPRREHTLANKNEAISFAAYRAAVDLFPGDKALFDTLMANLGYDINNTSTDVTTAAGIGNVACSAVLNFRHHDGSNQLGDLTPSGVAYADYTGYQPVNLPSTVPVLDMSTIKDPNHWQPLTYFNGKSVVTPKFIGAQWFKVQPFALSSADEFRSFVSLFGPALYDPQNPESYSSKTYVEQAQELIDMSANLTDEQKMIAEYWANGPHSELPPGHWDLFAEFVSERDHHTVDDDAKMFFALTNAIFDAAIASWTAKRDFDSVRPVTAISYLFHNTEIRSWGGPGKGTVTMLGADWIPYQPSTFPTPPFPEYISGHSTFSAAGATILALWTESEYFGDSVTFAAGASTTEPGITPANPVTLYWQSFHDAADQAGISRRYGGIHFKRGDLVGRAVGDFVGWQAWEKAQHYFTGH